MATDTALTYILLVLAAVFFALGAFNVVKREQYNPTDAGLFCFAVLLILQNLL